MSIENASYDISAEPWKGIPRSVDLLTWMRIVPWMRRSATTREYRVFYEDNVRKPASANKPWTLSLTLYGFIESMNLGLTGNWDMCVHRFLLTDASSTRRCPGRKGMSPKPCNGSNYAEARVPLCSRRKRMRILLLSSTLSALYAVEGFP